MLFSSTDDYFYTVDQREHIVQIKRNVLSSAYNINTLTPSPNILNDLISFPYTDDVMMRVLPNDEDQSPLPVKSFTHSGINHITGHYPFANDEIIMIHWKINAENPLIVNIQFSFYNYDKDMFIFQRFEWKRDKDRDMYMTYWFTMDFSVSSNTRDFSMDVISKYVCDLFKENHKRTEYIRTHPQHTIGFPPRNLGTPAEMTRRLWKKYGLI
jgi:hypothetical protein